MPSVCLAGEEEIFSAEYYRTS